MILEESLARHCPGRFRGRRRTSVCRLAGAGERNGGAVRAGWRCTTWRSCSCTALAATSTPPALRGEEGTDQGRLVDFEGGVGGDEADGPVGTDLVLGDPRPEPAVARQSRAVRGGGRGTDVAELPLWWG